MNKLIVLGILLCLIGFVSAERVEYNNYSEDCWIDHYYIGGKNYKIQQCVFTMENYIIENE